MPHITVLDQSTIDKIAAGEVIERPASVVKELLENAIDAKATAVTVEIRDGGISFIRVTDNGCGIPKDEVSLAFLRHSTSKIKSADDLFVVASLGFRGEALSSIAAVSQMELITKTAEQLSGVRYVIEGGKERQMEEIGAPDGTTFIVRNLFYNTPARQKFLKTAQTEGAHVAALVEKIAMSHPDISIRFIQNNQNKLHTSGNHNLKDIIYTVFGRDIAANLLAVEFEQEILQVKGFAGKPVIARSNRNFENYYINGRYVKSAIVAKAIEEAYRPFMMQHKYPFVLLHIRVEPEYLDVNVHPTKMELRFRDEERIYQMIFRAVSDALAHKELIPQVALDHTGTRKDAAAADAAQKKADAEKAKVEKLLEPRPEPFEVKRRGSLEGGRSSVTGIPMTADERSGMQNRPIETQQSSKARSISERQSIQNGSFAPSGEYSNRTVYQSVAEKQVEYDSEEARKAWLERMSKQPGTESNWSNDMKQSIAHSPKPVSLAQIAGKPETPQNMLQNSKGTSADTIAAADALPGTASEPQSSNTNRASLAPCLHGNAAADENPKQLDLFEEKLLTPQSRLRHKLIGQLFDTYWLVEFDDHLYIIDQHAAHEKVLYERTMKTLRSREYTSQMVNPPIILTLSSEEQILLNKYMDYFTEIGFEIEPFGGKEYAVRAIPDNLFSIAKKELLMEMLDDLSDDILKGGVESVYDRVATMSCKAAVKGNHRLSPAEADHLIDELLTLDNPYACPHGRPTIISMSKYELEKKFKRIV